MNTLEIVLQELGVKIANLEIENAQLKAQLKSVEEANHAGSSSEQPNA